MRGSWFPHYMSMDHAGSMNISLLPYWTPEVSRDGYLYVILRDRPSVRYKERRGPGEHSGLRGDSGDMTGNPGSTTNVKARQ